MTELSYPQQGILTGDATQAPYDADEFALHFMANMAGFARRANYGPVKGYDDGTHYGLEVNQTSVASANVLLRPGTAMVTGTVYENSADLTLAVGANASGNPRIDTVVIRKDFVLQTIRAAVLQGSPAASPVPPTLTQDATTWEIPIADIAVANGFSTITNVNINPRHEWVNVGDGVYVDNVLNNSGDVLEDGDVVIWDTTTTKAVTTTTTANSSLVAGVWRGRTADGEYGRIQVRGFSKLKLRIQNISGANSFNVGIGAEIVTSLQARKATVVSLSEAANVPGYVYGTDGSSISTSNSGYAPVRLAILQEAITVGISTTFDALVAAYIDVRPQRNPLLIRIYELNLSSGTFTAGAWTTRTLDTIRTNHYNSTTSIYVSLSANQFTLQPGAYYIQASAPAYRVDRHQIRLYDVTGAVTWGEAHGQIAYSPSAADSSQTRSELWAFVAISAARVFRIEHLCATTRATDGLGLATTGLFLGTRGTEVSIYRLGEIS